MTAVFWILGPISVAAALGMVLARKAVHAAMLLAVVMISLAIMYAALDAPFLFAAQIIVYTGAVMMLFLFVLMLVGVDASDSLVETLRGHRVMAILAGLGVGVVLVAVLSRLVFGPPSGLNDLNTGTGTTDLAHLLFHDYYLAFEAAGALLITAAVGTMVLAHREKLVPSKTQKDLSRERFERYAEAGEHPGQLPSPGVYSRHNAVDTPAMLPDGTTAPTSVSRALAARGSIQPPQRFSGNAGNTDSAGNAGGAGQVEPSGQVGQATRTSRGADEQGEGDDEA